MKYWIVLSMVWLAAIPDGKVLAATPDVPDVCARFEEGKPGSFNVGCRKYLDPLMAKYVYKDCKYFQKMKNEARLLDFLRNINFVCHCKGSSVCGDIVFLIDASNSVGDTDFPKFVDFVDCITDKLVTYDGSIVDHRVSWVTYSKEELVHGECLQHLESVDTAKSAVRGAFESDVSNTHLAVDRMNEIMTNCFRPQCAQVGVMLIAGTATNDDALFHSLSEFNNGTTARLIAIGINKEPKDTEKDLQKKRKDFKVEVQAIAHGRGMSNAIIVDDINDVVIEDVFEMITARRHIDGMCEHDEIGIPPKKRICTQYVTVNSSDHDNDDPNRYHGVYEEDPNTICIITEGGKEFPFEVFNQLEFEHKLSKVNYIKENRWIIQKNPRDPCYNETPIAMSALNPPGSLPDTSPYLEFPYFADGPKMTMKCFYWEE